MSKFKVKPGDLIDWVYSADQFRAIAGDELWSTPEGRWVKIDEAMLVVSVDVTKQTLLLLSCEGVFSFACEDYESNKTYVSDEYVEPRLIKRGIVPRVQSQARY